MSGIGFATELRLHPAAVDLCGLSLQNGSAAPQLSSALACFRGTTSDFRSLLFNALAVGASPAHSGGSGQRP